METDEDPEEKKIKLLSEITEEEEPAPTPVNNKVESGEEMELPATAVEKFETTKEVAKNYLMLTASFRNLRTLL